MPPYLAVKHIVLVQKGFEMFLFRKLRLDRVVFNRLTVRWFPGNLAPFQENRISYAEVRLQEAVVNGRLTFPVVVDMVYVVVAVEDLTVVIFMVIEVYMH